MTATLPYFRSMRALGALMALALFTVWISWRARTLEMRLTGGAEVSDLDGKPAPDFELSTLDGGSLSLADYREKKNVVVAFWASWCVPCHMELPLLKRFYEEQRKNGADFELLAISIDDDRAAARDYAAQAKLPFPVLLDGAQRTAENWHVRAIPILFVIDKHGKIIFSHTGANPAVDFLLAGELGIKNYKPEVQLPDAKSGN